MAKFTVQLNNQEIDLEVTRQGNRLHVIGAGQDGRSAEITLIHADGPTLLLEYTPPDGARRRIRLAGHIGPGDQRQMWVNGRVLTYQRVQQRGSGGQAGDGSLAASIPAVVTAVLVQPGDEVAEGDKLILLESMKMVIPILAPRAGLVAGVHCQPGESVQAGVPLIELKELESGD